jgi:hypothetical protein
MEEIYSWNCVNRYGFGFCKLKNKILIVSGIKNDFLTNESQTVQLISESGRGK